MDQEIFQLFADFIRKPLRIYVFNMCRFYLLETRSSILGAYIIMIYTETISRKVVVSTVRENVMMVRRLHASKVAKML